MTGRVMRLAELGYTLPEPVNPLGAYVTGVRVGDLAFFGGHGPLRIEGKPSSQGRLGVNFNVADIGQIAIGATLSVLASAQRLLGDIESIDHDQVLKACMFVACGSEAADPVAACEPAVALLTRLFKQPPAVTIVPVLVLPNNIPVMVELVVKVRP
jgi:enamine deaminase RidA (YjgF/YER057c/UK114 family)